MQPAGSPKDGLADRLISWFEEHRRDLPWRRDRDPYRVWVSEIMLQQTRVATVVPYFERWMRRFPDVAALAAADRDDVLKAWEGLGYYRRAHHLKDAAEMGNRKAKDTILGQGKGNYRALLKEVKRQGFKGLMAIEYEENTPALQDDMVKNVAFVKSVAKHLVGAT